VLPLVDEGFVSLQGAAYGLLDAPVQLPQDTPDVPGMITDFEASLDQVSNPLTVPQRSFVTQTLRTLMEQFDQPGFIGFIQTGQPSRSVSSPQSHVTPILVFLPPPTHGLVAHFQATTDLAVVQVLSK
jgi:hypothetical protein